MSDKARVLLDLTVAPLTQEATVSQKLAMQSRAAMELQGQKMVHAQFKWVQF
jgi:hypothetical protein